MTAIMELAVDALAVHRLTRLATADTITEPLRWSLVADLIVFKQQHQLTPTQDDAADAAELVALTQDPPKLAVLVTCRWCAGAWVTAAAMLLRWRRPRAWAAIARPLAVASASTLLAGLED